MRPSTISYGEVWDTLVRIVGGVDVNGDRLISVILAFCCLTALGTVATSLDSTVETTPDDVIDFDYASLPIPSDDARALKRQIQSRSADRPPQDAQETQTSDAPSTGEPVEQDAMSGDGTERGGGVDESGSRLGVDTDRGRERAPGAGEPSLLDQLLAFLQRLLDLLVSLLPLGLLLVGVGVAVRFRERLRALVLRLAERAGISSADDVDDGVGPPTPAPANGVERAWFEMVQRLGLADDLTRTPRACAQKALDAGVDSETVADLRETFESVRYGRAASDEVHEARARRALERFRAQYRGGDAP